MKRWGFGCLGAVSVLFGFFALVNAMSLLESIVRGDGEKTTWAVFLVCLILLLGSLYSSVRFFKRASARNK
jgi:hypothetical protein